MVLDIVLKYLIKMMEESINVLSLRWSDLDPNFHLRHTAYYDFAAQARIDMLDTLGFTVAFMQKENFGPVLFREECVFRREIRYGDQIQLSTKLKKARKNFSRFTVQHDFIRIDSTLCATVTIDAAWIDTRIRKLTVPPQLAQETFERIAKTEDFEWSE
jgi:acyl-CoA thioester hydrolase